jgi:hypothetical protein
MPAKTKARGRPPSPQKRTARLTLRFLLQAHEQIEKAAALDKDEPAGWGRRVCEIAAEHRVLHGITIQEAFAEAMKARAQLRK